MKQLRSASVHDKLTHDGKTLTIREWAKELGMSEEGFIQRVRYKEPAKWFRPNVSYRGRKKMLTHNGVTKPLLDWAKELGLTKEGMRERVRNQPESEWFLPRKSKEKFVTIDGVTKTIGEWCKHTGISLVTYRYRLGRGMSIEQALTTPKSESYVPPSYRPERKQKVLVTPEPLDPDFELKRFIEHCKAQNMTDEEILAEHQKRIAA